MDLYDVAEVLASYPGECWIGVDKNGAMYMYNAEPSRSSVYYTHTNGFMLNVGSILNYPNDLGYDLDEIDEIIDWDEMDMLFHFEPPPAESSLFEYMQLQWNWIQQKRQENEPMFLKVASQAGNDLYFDCPAGYDWMEENIPLENAIPSRYGICNSDEPLYLCPFFNIIEDQERINARLIQQVRRQVA